MPVEIENDVSPPKRKAKEQITITPTCSNCRYAKAVTPKSYECLVDLPPFIRRSDKAREYLVLPDYGCALHKPQS